MSTKKNKPEKTHKLSELIAYYEVCNKAEGKSHKTISWYSANLKRFRAYVISRHHNESIDSMDTKLLREYVLYLMSADSNGPFSTKRSKITGNSLLVLNSYFQRFADNDVWNERTIGERGTVLSELALKVWDYPKL